MRRPSRPCSGRGASGRSCPLRPPTAPSRTASASRQASSTSSVRAVPWASIEQPPRVRVELELPQDSSSRRPRRGSGPIPSPGRTTIGGPVHAARLLRVRRRAVGRDSLDVEAHVVEDQRLLGLGSTPRRRGARAPAAGPERPRVTVEVRASGSGGLTGFGCSQQRCQRTPPAQPLRSPRRRQNSISRRLAVGRERACGTSAIACACRRRCPRPALGHERPPGGERRAAPEEEIVVETQWKVAVGRRGRPVRQLELDQVGDV